MAYRFNGSSDKIMFSAAPIIGYTSGPITVAIYLKRTVAGTNDDLVGVFSSGGTARCALYASGGNQVVFDQNLGGGPGQTVSNTTTWYLIAATLNSSNAGRDHLHDGTSWAHAAVGSVGAGSFASGDQIGVSSNLYAGFLAGDVVCAGIKKSDSTDLAIETLSRTAFSAWQSFGFDWLIGFDTSFQSAGVLQDQASPGTGDQISISGTSVVSDPPGWAWSSAVTPVANFTGTPTSGTASLSVAFTDSSTNTPTSWAWDFGDGGTSTAQNPTHSYSTSGVYTVTLIATNAAGSNTKTRTGYITVSEAVVYATGAGIDIW